MAASARNSSTNGTEHSKVPHLPVPEITDSGDATELSRVKGIVSFNRVSFAYDGEPVLKDFDLRANPGEKIALVGPSGAGKTTVASLLTRFYDPQQGVVLIDDQDLRQLSQQSLAKNIALVDQETFLFNDTILDNIRYGRPDASDDEVYEAARLAYADEFIETCRATQGLSLRGLMCIPPMEEEPAMHFALLAELAKRHGLEQLSMGMSADFEIAIRLGATHVRVGTAVFGHRPST